MDHTSTEAGGGRRDGGIDADDPADPRNKYRTRESVHQLRALLIKWDLLLVHGVEEAADEYDCMISPLLRQLHAGAGQAQITDWLVDEVEQHFGVQSNPEREAALADRVTTWWQQRRTRSDRG